MKNVFSLTSKLICVSLLLLFVMCASASAQKGRSTNTDKDLVIHWEGRTLDSPPTNINHTEKRRIRIKEVNDILYQYRTEVTVVQPEFDGLAHIVDQLGTSLPPAAAAAAAANNAGGAPPCPAATAVLLNRIQVIVDEINGSDALPFKLMTEGAPVRSVPLKETTSAWARIQKDINPLKPAIDAALNCGANLPNDFRTQLTNFNNLVKGIEDKVNASSSEGILGPTITFSPGDTVTIKVFEFFEGRQTKDSPQTFTFATRSTILTLSGGVLISTVPNRTYEARKTPESTQNVLVVEGNSSFRPEGVLLLNYMIPRLDFADVGFALSGGPVVRFGSTGDTSSLGFFAGLSAHIHHQYYFTPGVHFGQFADFPTGFREGSAIPENFGELNPVKRWTARFGFAFTFRTKSFKSKPSTEAASSGGGSGSSASNRRMKNTTREPMAVASETKQIRDADRHPVSPSTEEPQMVRTAWLRSVKSSAEDFVILYADSKITKYRTYADRDFFYLVIPQTNMVADQRELAGNYLVSTQAHRSLGDVVVTFALRPGTKVHVREKFNRLEVSFGPEDKVQPVAGLRSIEIAQDKQ